MTKHHDEFECPACGNIFLAEWEEGEDVHCPECDGLVYSDSEDA